MASEDKKLSMRVVETVATALGKDSTDLPPLEQTISADALNALFHKGDQPEGAYTVFPYSGVWVLVHSTGTVDVFDEFMETSAADKLPADVAEPSADDQFLILHADEEQHVFSDDELDDVHAIIDGADDSDEAWEETIEYAQDREPDSR